MDADNFSSAEPRFVPATLRGFRQWLVGLKQSSYFMERLSLSGSSITGTKEVQLMSLNMVQWQGNHLTADCPYKERKHSAVPPPYTDCTCGIYALNFQDDWEIASTAGYPYRYISGVIKASGKVVFGQLGFRAQHAEIEAVHIPAPVYYEDHLVRETFKQQFPEILVFSSLESMYEQYPPDDFSSLFPQEVLERMNEAQEVHRQKTNQRRAYQHALLLGGRYASGDIIPPASFPGRIIDIP